MSHCSWPLFCFPAIFASMMEKRTAPFCVSVPDIAQDAHSNELYAYYEAAIRRSLSLRKVFLRRRPVKGCRPRFAFRCRSRSLVNRLGVFRHIVRMVVVHAWRISKRWFTPLSIRDRNGDPVTGICNVKGKMGKNSGGPTETRVKDLCAKVERDNSSDPLVFSMFSTNIF